MELNKKKGENEMTLNEYQKLAMRTINPDFIKNNDIRGMQYHALHGMAGVIGEIHNIYQKMYTGHNFDEDHMKKELCDLLWFIAEYCTGMAWDLDEIVVMNIDKFRARFPEGFEVNKSLHRDEGNI